jgi:plastocyanin
MKFRSISSVILSATLVLSTGALAACGDDDDDGASPTNASATKAPTQANAGGLPANLTKVTISDNKFTPLNLQVPVGATVTWEWTGSNPHSVKGTFDGKAIESPRLTGTGVYLEAFQKAGTFEYQCGVHGEAMKGTIKIQ